MTPDFRYHIASLSSVFLGLGIGILIGTGSVGAKVVQQQTSLMTRLNANFAELRKETREREQTEAALRLLLAGQVRGRLTGRSVLVIQVGGAADAADRAEEAVRLAGASAARVSLPTDSWSALPEALQRQKATQLAQALLANDPAPLEELRSAGLILGAPPEDFVLKRFVLAGGEKLVAGSSLTDTDQPLRLLARTRDLPLIARLVSGGGSVVATETYESDLALVLLWQGEHIATIDCINRSAGQLALPLALLGEVANYGMKPGADRLLPEGLTREPEPSPGPVPVPSP